jgi:aspartyl-tRNA(Asn)/glutamyl-tRNA(Gln) amidotransferase subunit B
MGNRHRAGDARPARRPRSKIFSVRLHRFGAEPNSPGLRGRSRTARRAAGAERGAVGAPSASAWPSAPRSTASRSSPARTTSTPICPKGYQISQYELPIVGGGRWRSGLATFDPHGRHLTRAHLEEDAGKSLHEDFHGMTGIDLNRAGTPLLEIVSEPDMRSSPRRPWPTPRRCTPGALARHLRRQHAGRQLPLRRQRLGAPAWPERELGTRCEIKNLNSFRFLEQAIATRSSGRSS